MSNYVPLTSPGNRLGIWADKIEQKRVAMRLDRSGFPLPPDDQDQADQNQDDSGEDR